MRGSGDGKGFVRFFVLWGGRRGGGGRGEVGGGSVAGDGGRV